METLKHINRHAVFTTFILLLILQVANGNGELLQLDCLERDWYTVFGKKDYDITSVEMTVTDTASTGMTRILVAFAEESLDEERNSYLAYLDYLTCESLFFIRK